MVIFPMAIEKVKAVEHQIFAISFGQLLKAPKCSYLCPPPSCHQGTPHPVLIEFISPNIPPLGLKFLTLHLMSKDSRDALNN